MRNSVRLGGAGLVGVCVVGAAIPSTAAASEVTTAEVVAAKRSVGVALRDPTSAQYRNLTAYRLPNGNVVLCGEINGRNALGAYPGYVRFLVVKDLALLDSGGGLESAQFRNANDQLCQGKAEARPVRP